MFSQSYELGRPPRRNKRRSVVRRRNSLARIGPIFAGLGRTPRYRRSRWSRGTSTAGRVIGRATRSSKQLNDVDELGYLAGKKKGKKKKWYKRAFSKKRLKHYAIAAGAIVGGAAAIKFAPGLFAKAKGFFKKSGMTDTAAAAAADAVLAGRQPMPEGLSPELQAEMQAQQAGMLGGMTLPLALAGGGVLLFMMMGGQKRGR